MIAGWAISDQKLERPEKQMFWRLSATFLSQHDANDLCEWRKGGRKEDEDTKPCVYGLSMTI